MLGNFDIARGKLTYGLSTNYKTVSGGASLEISYNDGSFVPANNNTTGIKAEMLDNMGTYSILIDKAKILATDYAKRLTIRYNRIITNDEGSVTYDNETTKTLQQWMDKPDELLARYKVVVKGWISYRYSTSYQDQGIPYSNNVTVTPGFITVGIAQGSYNPFTLTFSGNDVAITSVRFSYYDSSGYTYRAVRSLQELESYSWVDLRAL